MIVLRVADRDHFVRRHAEVAQRELRSGRLVDAGGQHHHRFAIEDHLQLEAELADRLDHQRFLRRMRRHDDLAHLEGLNATPAQRRDELLGRRIGEQRDVAASRVVNERAVLRNDIIEQIDAVANAQQIVQPASGHEDRAPAGRAQPLERGAGRVGDPAVRCQRVVVVACQRKISHWRP